VRARAAGAQVIFSYGQQSGYSEDMYGYTLQVVGAADSKHEYDYDGVTFKVHDQERRAER